MNYKETEDSKYICLEYEDKAVFLNSKSIATTYENAKLAFINSNAKMVFYKKEN